MIVRDRNQMNKENDMKKLQRRLNVTIETGFCFPRFSSAKLKPDVKE